MGGSHYRAEAEEMKETAKEERERERERRRRVGEEEGREPEGTDRRSGGEGDARFIFFGS